MYNLAGIRVEPLSLKQIRMIGKRLREVLFQLGFIRSVDEKYIDIVKLYEYFLQGIGIEFEIASIEEMGSKHGETLIGKNKIRIREDVYDRACDGYGRDRLTMAHELGHLLLHKLDTISFARDLEDREMPAYRDPEWQANAFAGEFLAPYELIKEEDIKTIAREHGVTEKAAKVQKRER